MVRVGRTAPAAVAAAVANWQGGREAGTLATTYVHVKRETATWQGGTVRSLTLGSDGLGAVAAVTAAGSRKAMVSAAGALPAAAPRPGSATPSEMTGAVIAIGRWSLFCGWPNTPMYLASTLNASLPKFFVFAKSEAHTYTAACNPGQADPGTG